MQGGLRGQAWLGSVKRVRVAYRGLGAGGPSGGATRGAILRGGFMVSNRLEETETERRMSSQTQPMPVYFLKKKSFQGWSCNKLCINNLHLGKFE